MCLIIILPSIASRRLCSHQSQNTYMRRSPFYSPTNRCCPKLLNSITFHIACMVYVSCTYVPEEYKADRKIIRRSSFIGRRVFTVRHCCGISKGSHCLGGVACLGLFTLMVGVCVINCVHYMLCMKIIHLY